MTGAGRHHRLVFVLYRAMLWLAALLAIGEAASAAEPAGRHGSRQVLERSLSPQDHLPGFAAPAGYCHPGEPEVLPRDSPPDAEIGEPLDVEWTAARTSWTFPFPRLPGPCGRGHLVRQARYKGGTHARAPPLRSVLV